MNNSIFADPYDEWKVVGKRLLAEDPEATVWDLIKMMFKYKTGRDINFAPDNVILDLHLAGLPPKNIVERLNALGYDEDEETINIVLDDFGFEAFHSALPVNVFFIHSMTTNGVNLKEMEERFGLTYYMSGRALNEHIAWREYSGEVYSE